jgi:hypothetical protein
MKPPTFPLVPALIDAWVSQVADFGRALQAGFERIHPFLD